MRVIVSTCLLVVSASAFAMKIQCQKVSDGPIQQCVATGPGASKLYGITNMPYALCSKALCTQDKKNPKQAQCACELYEGKSWVGLSISPTSYRQSKPSWNMQKELTTVQSNYSLANMTATPDAKLITCQFPKAMPWADCFGARCVVQDEQTAICACPVLKNKVFAITGPGTALKCVTKPDQMWSAILKNQAQGNSQFVRGLYKKLYPNAPVQPMSATQGGS